jgi:hypothetical protein
MTDDAVYPLDISVSDLACTGVILVISIFQCTELWFMFMEFVLIRTANDLFRTIFYIPHF